MAMVIRLVLEDFEAAALLYHYDFIAGPEFHSGYLKVVRAIEAAQRDIVAGIPYVDSTLVDL
jgi:hypothetical protein